MIPGTKLEALEISISIDDQFSLVVLKVCAEAYPSIRGATALTHITKQKLDEVHIPASLTPAEAVLFLALPAVRELLKDAERVL